LSVYFLEIVISVISMDRWGDPRRRWEDNIKADFRKWDVGVWTGLSWFKIEIVGGHL
jgi:hypothetical protein